jgi:hypothetical protein
MAVEFRIITDRKAQDAENYVYWRSRTTAERMRAVAELTRDAYARRGIDAYAAGPKTFSTRLQQTRG